MSLKTFIIYKKRVLHFEIKNAIESTKMSEKLYSV